MCGGAILVKLIPPSAGRAPKQVAAGWVSPKKGDMSKRHHSSIPDVDDFKAAFEDFDDDYDRWRTTATTMSFLHPNLPSPRVGQLSWFHRVYKVHGYNRYVLT